MGTRAHTRHGTVRQQQPAQPHLTDMHQHARARAHTHTHTHTHTCTQTRRAHTQPAITVANSDSRLSATWIETLYLRYFRLLQTYLHQHMPTNHPTGPPSAPKIIPPHHTFSIPVFVPPSLPASVPPSILPSPCLAWRPSPPDAAPPSARTRSSQKYPSCRSCAFTDHAHCADAVLNAITFASGTLSRAHSRTQPQVKKGKTLLERVVKGFECSSGRSCTK